MKRVLLFLLALLFIIPGVSLKAATMQSVLINEVAWMGSTTSANNEWLELFNTTNALIDLSGWTLQSSDGNLTIHLKGLIPAKGFYLLERTDDNSVPGAAAGLIYKGSLSNNGMALKISDAFNTLIDEVNYQNGWPTGDNTKKQTMERTPTLNWQTSAIVNGTPKAINSSGTVKITKAPLQQNYPAGIFINEFIPYPESPVSENQWVELYNSSDSLVDISGWKLKNSKGALYVFPNNLTIAAHHYLVLPRTQTNLILKRDTETISLLFPSNVVADSMSYKNAPKNKSYNKGEPNWQWNTPTPGTENIITETLSNSYKSDTNSSNTAAVSNSITNVNPGFLLLIATGILIISGTSILIWKQKH